MNNQSIYISGPIAGMPHRNQREFSNAESVLKNLFAKVVNPCALPALARNECLRRDIALLMECDAIYMLYNFEQSKGAMLELFVATQVGIKVMFQ